MQMIKFIVAWHKIKTLKVLNLLLQKMTLLHSFKFLMQNCLLTFIGLDEVDTLFLNSFNLKQSLHRQGAGFLRKNKLLHGIVAFNKGFQRTIRISCTLHLPSESQNYFYFSNNSWNKFDWNEILCLFQAPWKQKSRYMWRKQVGYPSWNWRLKVQSSLK